MALRIPGMAVRGSIAGDLRGTSFRRRSHGRATRASASVREIVPRGRRRRDRNPGFSPGPQSTSYRQVASSKSMFRKPGELKEHSEAVLVRTGRMKSHKTSKRSAFVSKHIKHRIQLGDLKKIADFLRQVQQLQVPALILHRRVPADQLADSRAVDVVHVSQVQQNQFSLILQQSPNRLSQQSAAVAEDDATTQIHDGYLPGISMRRM